MKMKPLFMQVRGSRTFYISPYTLIFLLIDAWALICGRQTLGWLGALGENQSHSDIFKF
jgi:hypothetical protein